jgi:UDP-N-acetylmuramate-alanine ligase
MSGLAELLVSTGDEVSGSDIDTSDTRQYGKEISVTAFDTHIAENTSGVGTVVVSDAAPGRNVPFAPSDVFDGQACGAFA